MLKNNLRLSTIIRFFCILTLSISSVAVYANEDDNHQEEFNAGEMIMHHIQDAHEIHLMGDFAIYLPVIIKTDDGLDIFSSSHFYHNQKEITGEHDEVEHYYAYDKYVM